MKGGMLTLAAAACMAGWLCGCGEGQPKVTSADLKAFDGAAPELKQAWAEAHAAAATNNYGAAVMKLRSMLPHDLSVPQVETIQNAMRAYNLKLLAEADKGDPAALKALEEIRASSARPSP